MAADNEYPLVAFRFSVEWGNSRIGFTEVSGLTTEVQPIEYRDGSSKDYSVVKMPGMTKYPNIVMKRGIIKGDASYIAWIKDIKHHNPVNRRPITIKLLDESGNPVVTWKVKNAFPIKVEGPALKSTGNESAIESMEMAHEGFEVEFA